MSIEQRLAAGLCALTKKRYPGPQQPIDDAFVRHIVIQLRFAPERPNGRRKELLIKNPGIFARKKLVKHQECGESFVEGSIGRRWREEIESSHEAVENGHAGIDHVHKLGRERELQAVIGVISVGYNARRALKVREA